MISRSVSCCWVCAGPVKVCDGAVWWLRRRRRRRFVRVCMARSTERSAWASTQRLKIDAACSGSVSVFRLQHCRAGQFRVTACAREAVVRSARVRAMSMAKHAPERREHGNRPSRSADSKTRREFVLHSFAAVLGLIAYTPVLDRPDPSETMRRPPLGLRTKDLKEDILEDMDTETERQLNGDKSGDDAPPIGSEVDKADKPSSSEGNFSAGSSSGAPPSTRTQELRRGPSRKDELDELVEMAGKPFVLNPRWMEDDLEDAKAVFRRLAVLGFVALYSLTAILISERSEGRITLPRQYDVEQIRNYFRPRPELVLVRTCQILWEAVGFGTGFVSDKLWYELRRRFDEFFIENLETRLKRLEAEDQKLNVRAFAWNTMQVSLISGARKVFRVKQPSVGQYWDWRWSRRAALNRQAITRLGPAFIKLGQAISSRPDVVGSRMSRELQRLQDDMPFFSNEEAFEFIRREVGAHPRRLFESISQQPVAAASIGQVYKAKLDGIDVAVKIQRPGIVEVVALDFHVIRNVAEFATSVFPFSTLVPPDLCDIVDDYASRLFEELDYVQEGRNVERFRELYGNYPGFKVPMLFQQYSSEHVLIMEWIDGTPLISEDYNYGLSASGSVSTESKALDSYSKLVSVADNDLVRIENGIRCCLAQLLDVGFVHGDPSENLIRTRDGKLALVDYGVVVSMAPASRYAIVSSLLHLLNRQYDLLAEDVSSVSIMKDSALDMRYDELAKALRTVFEPYVGDGISGFSFIGLADQFLTLASRFPFAFPPFFINNIRALGNMEDMALQVDPNFKMAKLVFPLVIEKVFNDPAPEMRETLEEILLADYTFINWKDLQRIITQMAYIRLNNTVLLSDTANARLVSAMSGAPSPAPSTGGASVGSGADVSADVVGGAGRRRQERRKRKRNSRAGSLSASDKMLDAASKKAEMFEFQTFTELVCSRNGSMLTTVYARQVVDIFENQLEAKVNAIESFLLPRNLQPVKARAHSLDRSPADGAKGVRRKINSAPSSVPEGDRTSPLEDSSALPTTEHSLAAVRRNRREARVLIRRMASLKSRKRDRLRLLPLILSIGFQVFMAVILRLAVRVTSDVFQILDHHVVTRHACGFDFDKLQRPHEDKKNCKDESIRKATQFYRRDIARHWQLARGCRCSKTRRYPE
ncbi:putative aarF domain-containing protein kinase, chloroplastic [Porphyridium purpureum]|uniref:Putative aarF domain-containing protein kinase, chloroplastic n=1 Tax=Porphyridium purpureum TaxID=35688 RepID=A0A5J4YTY6_PORPP|nr:putative aarF domain-containing protein kinase, chloroplastic [Porphyridium purpureum]|eukprot:POR4091..scf227_4